MKRFRHMDAHTLAEAVAALAGHGDKARLIAGGTDLLGLLKTRALPDYPELLINIKKIPGLRSIDEEGGELRIGALTRLEELAASPVIQQRIPMLAEAAESVAMPQIRTMGTLGGNLAQDTRCWYYRYPHEIGGRILCRRKGEGPCLAVTGDNRYHALFGAKRCFAVCPSDTAVALAVLDASLQIAGPEGERSLRVEDFYHPLGNALGPGEIVTAVHVPIPPSGSRQVFIKHRVRRSIDFATVSVGVAFHLDKGTCGSARVVLGAVAPGPHRAVKAEEFLSGRAVNEDSVAAAAAAAVEGAVPLSRNAYKIDIAKALVKRALLAGASHEN